MTKSHPDDNVKVQYIIDLLYLSIKIYICYICSKVHDEQLRRAVDRHTVDDTLWQGSYDNYVGEKH